MQCSCGHMNSPEAKVCGRCGEVLMGAGVGYNDRAPAMGAAVPPTRPESPGVGGVPPTQQEFGGEGAVPPTNVENPDGLNIQMGGAAEAGPIPGMPQGPRGGVGRTILQEETYKPLAGWLVVVRSKQVAPYTEIPIYKGNNTIGRNPALGNHCLNDEKVSTQHLLLIASSAGVDLTDLGSSNGTVVNNQQVRTHHLERGDRVRLGLTTAIFIPLPGERQA